MRAAVSMALLLLPAAPASAQVGRAAEEAVFVASRPDTAASPIPAGCRPEVPHLIRTTWGQAEPYFDETPTDSAGAHCMTGCIATALAQIMNFYRFPARTADGEKLRWRRMLPAYAAGRYSKRQGRAVARLMARCGRAVRMNYGAEVSLSYPREAAGGVARDFGYIVKDYGYKDYPLNPNYDDAKWKEVVYRELSAGRPVLYGGTSYKHGGQRHFSHSFVLDGYDRQGRVHANFGYGGRGDGYFDVDRLPMRYDDVDEEFDTYQTLVVIHRPEDGPIDYDLAPLSPPEAP